MTTRRPESARTWTSLGSWVASGDGAKRIADLLTDAVSRRQFGGALVATLASFGLTGAGDAKKKKKNKKKKRPTGGCTSPGAPDSTICTTQWAGCGGSHQCCGCRYDTSDRLLCLVVALPTPPDGSDPFPPCQSNEDCDEGRVCNDYSKHCLPVCIN